MTIRKTILIFAILLLGALMFSANVAASDQLVDTDTVIWELTKTTVVDPGQTVIVPADQSGFPGGILVTGYTLEAKAKSKSGKLVPEGTFRLTMSVFSPNADWSTQKAGIWYVEGTWTVIDKNAAKEALKARHNPYTVRGNIHSDLLFNPTEIQGSWSAEATVPMSLAAGQWARGSNGSLTLNDQLEGDIFLTLKLWPSLQQ